MKAALRSFLSLSFLFATIGAAYPGGLYPGGTFASLPGNFTIPDNPDGKKPEAGLKQEDTWYLDFDTLHVRGAGQRYVSRPDTLMISLAGIGNGSFAIPVNGKIISPFGYRSGRLHAGIDIKLNEGDSVRCAFDGTVRMARYYFGYGNCVVVRHKNGLETLYGHLSRIGVKVNDAVAAGGFIGSGGHTGRATCSHLHFETFFQGNVFNPKQIIDFDAQCLTREKFLVTQYTFGLNTDFETGASPGNTCTKLLADIDNPESDPETAADDQGNIIADRNISPKELHKVKSKAVSKKENLRYHTVKHGDTLYSISRKNNMTVSEMCSLNGIKADKTLNPGVKLKVK